MSMLQKSLFTGSPRFNAAGQAQSNPLSIEGRWLQLIASNPISQLARVEGPFALGLRLEDGTVWLAVDRFGMETLCYRVIEGQLQFSTRADELHDATASNVNDNIDPQAIFDYLYFHCIPSPRTIFKGVYRLPPGHYAKFENSQLTVAPYWQPEFTEHRSSASFGVLKDEFRGLLRTAVAHNLDGSVPACFLSGGTDSSTVAGMIREASGQTAHSYSIGFDAEGYDEMAYARLAAKHFETQHHEYYVTPDDLVRSIADVATFYDQPFGNSSALPAYYCAKVARENGVTRILAGDGGDELFGGNSRYAKQRIFGWYQRLPASLRRGVMEPFFESSLTNQLPFFKKGSSYIEQAKVGMPARLQMYNLLIRLGVNDVLTPEFLAQVDVNSPAKHQHDVWNQSRQTSELNRTLAFDWRYTLGESDLPKVRTTCAMAGLDVGFPMLDDALLAFSMKLPDTYKLKGVKLRWFFKEALRGFLPDEILVKKKQGFGLPFGVWLTRHTGLMNLAMSSLSSLSERNIIEPKFIKSLFEKRLAEHPSYYGEMVWVLMMLEFWLSEYATKIRKPFSEIIIL